jgi:hypothetical protein
VCCRDFVQPGVDMPKEPRLFQLSNATGHLRVDEIADFSQEDLVRSSHRLIVMEWGGLTIDMIKRIA